jgi:3-carboxy-cis,cis-muconate cycloisomerase
VALGDEACLRAMLAFESALARAQAEAGVIPAAPPKRSRPPARAACSTWRRSSRRQALGEPGGPLVEALRAEVRRYSPHAALHVHFGATSQDVLDTALALSMRTCLEEATACCSPPCVAHGKGAGAPCDADVGAHADAAGDADHRGTEDRALGARPAFGARPARQAREGIAVQFGGPVGALESLGGRGPDVRRALAGRLGLADAIAGTRIAATG